MLVSMLKCKIHRATVTEANLNYAGSLTLDPDLIDASGLLINEKVHVLNVHTGDRFETYIIEGHRGSGTVCLNGAAARLGHAGDLVIIIAYAMMDEKEACAWKPRIVHVDERNHIVSP